MKKLLVVAFAAVMLTGCGFHTEQTEFTVKRSERVCGKEDCRYLVFTDKGTYENTDSLIHGKWNSSDVHGDLVSGQKYVATVAGYRVPFLSLYQNIVEYRTVK